MSPRRSSLNGLAIVERHVPDAIFIPVRGIRSSKRPAKGFHALSSLMRIQQFLNETRRSQAPLLCITVDPIPQLGAHLDGCIHINILLLRYTEWYTSIQRRSREDD